MPSGIKAPFPSVDPQAPHEVKGFFILGACKMDRTVSEKSSIFKLFKDVYEANKKIFKNEAFDLTIKQLNLKFEDAVWIDEAIASEKESENE